MNSQQLAASESENRIWHLPTVDEQEIQSNLILSSKLYREEKMHRVQFISLEESDTDIIVSFAIEDSTIGVKSLILLRSLFFEEFLDEGARGVKVSMEGAEVEQEHLNVLNRISIKDNEIEIIAVFDNYRIDISRVEASEIEEMIGLLKKQNYDNRFIIDVA